MVPATCCLLPVLGKELTADYAQAAWRGKQALHVMYRVRVDANSRQLCLVSVFGRMIPSSAGRRVLLGQSVCPASSIGTASITPLVLPVLLLCLLGEGSARFCLFMYWLLTHQVCTPHAP